jgi:hypothetical protein
MTHIAPRPRTQLALASTATAGAERLQSGGMGCDEGHAPIKKFWPAQVIANGHESIF